jgi:hypothetical protein
VSELGVLTDSWVWFLFGFEWESLYFSCNGVIMG